VWGDRDNRSSDGRAVIGELPRNVTLAVSMVAYSLVGGRMDR